MSNPAKIWGKWYDGLPVRVVRAIIHAGIKDRDELIEWTSGSDPKLIHYRGIGREMLHRTLAWLSWRTLNKAVAIDEGKSTFIPMNMLTPYQLYCLLYDKDEDIRKLLIAYKKGKSLAALEEAINNLDKMPSTAEFLKKYPKSKEEDVRLMGSILRAAEVL